MLRARNVLQVKDHLQHLSLCSPFNRHRSLNQLHINLKYYVNPIHPRSRFLSCHSIRPFPHPWRNNLLKGPDKPSSRGQSHPLSLHSSLHKYFNVNNLRLPSSQVQYHLRNLVRSYRIRIERPLLLASLDQNHTSCLRAPIHVQHPCRALHQAKQR